MKSYPNRLFVYVYGEEVDAFCEAVDPGGDMQYKEIFDTYGNRINAKYNHLTEDVIFNSELDKLAFLLKYSK